MEYSNYRIVVGPIFLLVVGPNESVSDPTKRRNFCTQSVQNEYNELNEHSTN